MVQKLKKIGKHWTIPFWYWQENFFEQQWTFKVLFCRNLLGRRLSSGSHRDVEQVSDWEELEGSGEKGIRLG